MKINAFLITELFEIVMNLHRERLAQTFNELSTGIKRGSSAG